MDVYHGIHLNQKMLCLIMIFIVMVTYTFISRELWGFGFLGKQRYIEKILKIYPMMKFQKGEYVMKKIKVYIASPYTKGDTAINVRNQIEAADLLMTCGFVPFVPLLSHFQHIIFPRDYQDWIEYDLEWVPTCDCLLRLEGDSHGADNEVKKAIECGMPVFYTANELITYYREETI